MNVGNETENVRLGLDLSAAAHIIGVLTDLYSDPIAAVVREYSTNALDSHIEAGNSAPIEISLPTVANPFFKVRDFGLGLSIDGIRDTYALYGRSTKRDSDDVNGMLGLGCKSALTYATSFNIMSVHDGVKVLATVVKDLDGVGVIKILDTVMSPDPNGVEISVPVKSYDILKFAEKAQGLYYLWKKGTVTVNGGAPDSIWDDPALIWLDDSIAVKMGTGYGLNHVIVQHNVGYPTNIEGLLPKIQVTAFVPIGSINFTPSREALHHTPRTKETLVTLKDYINTNLMRVLTERVENAPTKWEQAKVASGWAAMLRQSFKGIDLNIRCPAGYPIFLGRTTGGYGRQAEYTKESNISVQWFADDAKVLVVTGYNLRTMTQLAKLRLRDYRSSKGYKTAVLLPANCENMQILQGRPNVVSWESIIAVTEHVRVERTSEKRDETVYTCYQGNTNLGALTLKEIAALNLPVTYSILSRASGVFPEVVTVVIAYISRSRILKRFPDAKEAWQYQRDCIKERKETLTTDDLLYLAAHKDNFLRYLQGLPVDQIEDPLLRYGLQAQSGKQSLTLQEYLRVGGDLASVSTPDTYSVLVNRYPLLRRISSPVGQEKLDVVMYANAKFASIQEKENQ